MTNAIGLTFVAIITIGFIPMREPQEQWDYLNNMRVVKLFWKSRVTRKRKADIVRYTKTIYDEVKDCGEYLRLKAPRNDTKFVWIFMLSKTFKDIQ